ncbi:MAG: hypothetical protein IKT78_02425 [Ruminiclostridium sp.]|nr:hypothetical protein [Ruminiclostridium sp.]
MGQVIKVSCKKCEKSKELFIGGGMSDCEFDAIVSALSDEQKQKLIKARENNGSDFSVSRTAAICQGCGCFYTVSEVTYTELGRKKSESSRCPSCNSAKKREIDIDNNKTKCTECNTPIDVEVIGLWD